MQRQVA
ncbi:unnamed protein product [Linum tenue]|nr:unnamed protein product [Linum tenue]